MSPKISYNWSISLYIQEEQQHSFRGIVPIHGYHKQNIQNSMWGINLHSYKNFASICVYPIKEIYIGHKVLMTVTMMNSVFRVVRPFGSNTAPYFRGTYCLHHQGQRVSRASLACFPLLYGLLFNMEVGGSVFHQNIGVLCNYVELQPGKRYILISKCFHPEHK